MTMLHFKPMMKKIAMDLNNVACAFIEKGLHKHATKILPHAIKAVVTASKNPPDTGCDVYLQRMESILEAVSAEQVKLARLSSTSLCESTEAVSFIQQRPLHTHPKRYHQCHSTKLRVILSYNLAIAKHLYALEQSNSSTSRELHAALELYRWVHNRTSVDKDNRTYSILTLTVLNNMAQINHVLVQYGDAEKCFQSLLQLTDSKKSPDIHVRVSAYFRRNVAILREAEKTSPAA